MLTQEEKRWGPRTGASLSEMRKGSRLKTNFKIKWRLFGQWMDMERTLGVENDRQRKVLCVCACERERERGGLAGRVVLDTACQMCWWDTGRDVQGASGFGGNVSTRVKRSWILGISGIRWPRTQARMWSPRDSRMNEERRPRADPRGTRTFKDFAGEENTARGTSRAEWGQRPCGNPSSGKTAQEAELGPVLIDEAANMELTHCRLPLFHNLQEKC